MRYLDLTKLIGGEHMTTFCTLAKNRLSFPTKTLIDSGANGFAFIDTTFLKHLSPFFKPILHSLKSPLQVKGYNSIQGRKITHYTLLNLTVDSRIQSFTPFLITHLGSRSVILGRYWLAENRILVDCAKRKLHWPKDIPRTTTYAHNIPVQLRGDQAHMVNRYYQADAEHRDRQLDDYWQKKQPIDLNLSLLDNSNSLPVAPLTYFAPPGGLNPTLSPSTLARKVTILKKAPKGEMTGSVVQINKLDIVYIINRSL
jgi:hypothetical protein